MNERQERMTRQRAVILEELKKVKCHPTAYDVYEKVRQKLPRISLGTVYRNLEHLASQGLIRRLDLGPGQRRFDADMDDHTHIRCVVCGRVEDVPLNRSPDITTMYDVVRSQTGYEVMGCELDFHGVCPSCRHESA
ncbi:MAG TPA: transcriptional repressor [Deltaproteobacteria bacterium]|nr:transcriptional repressor [Deltaproteobacteria bacterium]HPR53903.1 transcriptional repressor [Deltaproteobacteria bacterium]HXK46703.1 transcriptional repressor [Deltaproteobacteria bacterium]